MISSSSAPAVDPNLRTERYKVDEWGVQYNRQINKTGSPSVLGEAVETSSTDNMAVKVSAANSFDLIGAMGEAGITDGALVWVAYAGPVQWLLEDGTAATRHYWARSSIGQPGRIDATTAAPPGGGVVQLTRHTQENGHVLESVGATTPGGLCRIWTHFL